jgi:site-specific recombinase XerD
MPRPNFTFRPRGNESIELFRSGYRDGSIELIYWQPYALKRHRCAPLLKEREEFLLHLLKQGVRRVEVQLVATMLLRAIEALQLKRLRDLDMQGIRNAIRVVWGTGLSKRSTFYGHKAAYAFRSVLKRFLHFHGRLKPLKPLGGAFWQELNCFTEFNRTRYRPSTLDSSHRKVATFLSWFTTQRKRLSRVSVNDIDKFIDAKKKGGWSPATIGSTIQALRVFFRYAATQGWSPNLADGIDAPFYNRIPTVPRGRTWSEVEQLLDATNGRDMAAVRAKAAFLLISTYGLRSGEVAQLLLSDFDWRKATLTVRRTKGGRQQRHPIPADVRHAVLSYIKIRPRCAYPNLFVTLRARYRPIGKRSLYELTSYRLKKLGIASGCLGPHAIRHARATQLLNDGTSIKEIGDFLGQRHPESPFEGSPDRPGSQVWQCWFCSLAP